MSQGVVGAEWRGRVEQAAAGELLFADRRALDEGRGREVLERLARRTRRDAIASAVWSQVTLFVGIGFVSGIGWVLDLACAAVFALLARQLFRRARSLDDLARELDVS